MLSSSNNFGRRNFDNIMNCNFWGKKSAFENRIFIKVGSVTRDSPLGPNLQDTLCDHSLIWLIESLEEFKADQ